MRRTCAIAKGGTVLNISTELKFFKDREIYCKVLLFVCEVKFQNRVWSKGEVSTLKGKMKENCISAIQ